VENRRDEFCEETKRKELSMTRIITGHIYTNEPANDDRLIGVPMWSGMGFDGYAWLKGGERPPSSAEAWEV